MSSKRIAIIEFFEKIPDPRQQTKILYSLNEIFLLMLCAVIAGADSYVEIEKFGKAKIDFLRRFLPYQNGIPSHDTIGTVFSKIDSKDFSKVFISWVRSLQKTIPNFVAIDGKTVRRSMDGKIKPLHVVSAWASAQNIVLGQVKTEEKSNEITAIPELLDMLVLKGAIITIDAMGCQKKICGKILEKKADYLIALKDNQRNLRQEVSIIFEAADSQTYPVDIQEYTTNDGGHGRVETRICAATDSELVSMAAQWPGLKTIARIERITEKDGESRKETRFFISSLPPDAPVISSIVRGHWGIENSLHWVLDIVFREDECRVRKNHGAANFVTMRHITQNMLRKMSDRMSMRVKRKNAGWDEGFLERALMIQPE